MLWKLLKYDFRSMFKQFAFIWPAALLLALVNRFILPFENNEANVSIENGELLAVITITVFIGVLIAMFVVAMVFILQRFYRGLLGDEGYLMHTLPVSAWQLVASKLVCALFVTVANMAVACLAVFLLFPISWWDLFDLELWRAIFRGLAQHPDTLLYLFEFCLLMLAGLALAMTTLYLAMAVGHLFARRRVLMSVVAFFAIDVAVSVAIDAAGRLGLLNWLDILVMRGQDHAASLAYLVLILIPTALFFWGTSYILKTRLNLE